MRREAKALLRRVAGACLLLMSAWVIGVRWLRGRRRLVLFLRRFGLTEPTRALTEALAGHLGRDWRMLTLDDECVAPVGVGSRTLGMAKIGRRVVRLAVLVSRPGRARRYIRSGSPQEKNLRRSPTRAAGCSMAA